MSKMIKTMGKLKLWAILGAVVMIAGIVIAAIFGMNADSVLSDSRTLGVKLDSYLTDERSALIREVCEEEIDKAGIDYEYSTVNEFSGTGCEVLYVFGSDVKEETLNAVKTAAGDRLSEATKAEGNILYGAYIYVTVNEESILSVLPEGYIWRAVLAGVVALVLEFIYVSVRYRLNMGVTATVSTLFGTLVTLAVVVLARIPVSASIVYVAAFALLYTALLSLFALNAMRAAFKTDEYKGKTAEDAIASAVPAKEMLIFVGCTAAALVLVGAIATAAVRWFAVAALAATLIAAYTALLLLPAMYLPVKKAADKRAAMRARYDYKSPKEKKREAKAEEQSAAPSEKAE